MLHGLSLDRLLTEHRGMAREMKNLDSRHAAAGV
jgi:hypothetical protein